MYSLHGLQQKESYRKEKDIWYKIKLSYSVLIEKISSLLSVDYCKSNKKNQFKDIRLQLHASTVTNPYTFSIQGNRSFSASCAIDKTLYNLFSVMTGNIPNYFIGYNSGNGKGTLSPTTFNNIKILYINSAYEISSLKFVNTAIILSGNVGEKIFFQLANTDDVYTFSFSAKNSDSEYVYTNDIVKFAENDNYSFYLY